LRIRKFTPDDAEFCFKVRSSAYIAKFYKELGPAAVAACVNAYMPADYVRMSEETEVFVVEDEAVPLGFFTIKRVDRNTAELPLIYLDLGHIGQGIGAWCIGYIEDWIRANWREVRTLVVDTIIPRYNGGFYQKVGFRRVAETFCEFPDQRVPAIRFEKRL